MRASSPPGHLTIERVSGYQSANPVPDNVRGPRGAGDDGECTDGRRAARGGEPVKPLPERRHYLLFMLYPVFLLRRLSAGA
jgi:hypothetical protein